ncbi:hypothetical protein FACS1894211_14270 [Clostridia bacterium]|nr:hypothetical protein FACS1894211_14270 [Clostridia bacterium]
MQRYKNMDFYDRITSLLKQKGITKRQLCAETEISYNTLASLFARRSKNIGVETLEKIAEYLEVPLDYLIGGNVNFLINNSKPNPVNTVSIITEECSYRYDLSDEQIKALITILDNMTGTKRK